MSFFKKLFGGGATENIDTSTAETYLDYTIIADPQSDGGSWRVAGRIEKREGDAVLQRQFTRADTFSSKDEAIQFSVMKAKKIIDEQGGKLFAKENLGKQA